MISPERFRQILSESAFKASRSSGAGGQHVNKVSSRISLCFNVRDSLVLDEREKARIIQRLGSRLNAAGELCVHSQESRSQYSNKEDAKRKLYGLLAQAFREKKKRLPTRVSKAAKERRLKGKKVRGEVKRLRGKAYE